MTWEQEQIGACTLYRGDAREVLPTLGRVDALVTDPPYGLNLTGKKHDVHDKRLAVKRAETYRSYADTPDNFVGVVVPAIRHALALARCGAVFMAGCHISQLPPGELGGIYIPNGCHRMAWGFQNFMHVVFYGPDPYQAAGKGCRPNGCYGLAGNDANTIAHPCAKPLAAMVWVVNRVSFPGQQVLDPFMGSGTTGVACVQLGRSFIGCEIEPRYFDVACKRIEDVTRQGDLFVPSSSVPRAHQEVLL